jgi:hypothetical protein
MKLKRKGKRAPDMDISDLGFDESLARFMQAKPIELASAHERISAYSQEIRQNVAKQKGLIDAGGREFKKPFGS